MSSAVAACLATLTIQIFGRRTILITGYFFMALSLLVCGYSVYEGRELAAFITLCFYIGTFDISQGSIAWLYVPEVTVDAAAGFATGAQYVNLMLVAFTFEFMINSSLNVHGTLMYYGGMTFLGFLFCLCCVRETRGLTDLEKKTLYTPRGMLEEQVVEMKETK